MTIEVRPVGVACNLRCTYCYQGREREANPAPGRHDLGAIKEAILAEGGAFSLFGGEPLLTPIRDLEELWALGHRRFGKNAVQTNATLITEAHVELFKRFNVHVGISLDGPAELNDARWHGERERTREATRNVNAVLRRLLESGISVGLIFTLTRVNASAERLPRLVEWLKELQSFGLRNARVHLLEVDSEQARTELSLTDAELAQAFSALRSVDAGGLKLDLFEDVRNLLLGRDRAVTCSWRACDPMTTRAVQGIDATGQRSNCGRVNKDGVAFEKARRAGFERYLALYSTPHEYGGCSGCRFFSFCKGQCPGTAIDGDWRNRTEHCGTWFGLFAEVETELIASGEVPLSCSPARAIIEAELVAAWAGGVNLNITDVLA